MRYVQRYVLSLGLLATGVTAATYHFAQIDTIGACGKGGWSLTVVIGPTCPPGRDAMLVVMLAGLILGLVGATIYAARGTSDGDPAKVRRKPFYWGNLHFWPTLALAFVVAEFVHPDKEQFRPGPEVIAIGIGSLLVVTALGVKTAQWWEGLGADPPPPAIVDQRAGAGRAKALAAALALLAMLAGAYGAYALQRSVGPKGPRVALRVLGDGKRASASARKAGSRRLADRLAGRNHRGSGRPAERDRERRAVVVV